MSKEMMEQVFTTRYSCFACISIGKVADGIVAVDECPNCGNKDAQTRFQIWGHGGQLNSWKVGETHEVLELAKSFQAGKE